MPLLDIRDVTKVYRVGGILRGSDMYAVDHVSLTMTGEAPTILSIVGESGSGKTTLAKAILRLIEPTSGSITIDGSTPRSDAAFRRLVQPISQNPFEAFSLRRKVEGYLLDTALRVSGARTKVEARERVVEALTSVGLDPSYVAGKYPSHFSGGELQRMSIARALICRPKLIIADEPVAMIDASLKMNVVNLFLTLRDQYAISFVYITHDLSTAYYVSDYIAIMYRGTVVEYGRSSDILTVPAHPYTQLLMSSVPTVGVKWESLPDAAEAGTEEAPTIMGCKFAGRCAFARDICRLTTPPTVAMEAGRRVLCYKPVDYKPVSIQEAVKEPALV